MYEIDTEKLIKTVKTHPAIYNKSEKLYHSPKKHREKVWREIGEEVHGNWSQLSQLHKAEYVRDIQKRWKSLRTCFARELALQKKERETGQQVKRRKRYEYFDNLLFIIDAAGDGDDGKDSDDSADPLESKHQSEDIVYDVDESSNDVKNHRMKIDVPEHYPQPQVVYERNKTLEERVLDMLKDIKKDENDEDRQFMLSLIPTFRKLKGKQKLAARIEMLKILQRHM